MKRILITLAMAVSLLVPSLALVGASADPINPVPDCGSGSASGTPDVCQDVGVQPGNTDANGKLTNDNPIVKIIKEAIIILSFIIGIGAVIGIVVSGLRMVFSGGNSEAIASARSGLIYSVAGLAVALLAQALVAFVLDNIG